MSTHVCIDIDRLTGNLLSDYMSKTYEELHIREPSIDLINRFKMDLERARSMTRTE